MELFYFLIKLQLKFTRQIFFVEKIFLSFGLTGLQNEVFPVFEKIDAWAFSDILHGQFFLGKTYLGFWIKKGP